MPCRLEIDALDLMGVDARASGISGCALCIMKTFRVCVRRGAHWHESGAYMLDVDPAPGPALLRTALARLNASGVLGTLPPSTPGESGLGSGP